jgi:hypothetical protein
MKKSAIVVAVVLSVAIVFAYWQWLSLSYALDTNQSTAVIEEVHMKRNVFRWVVIPGFLLSIGGTLFIGITGIGLKK